MRKKVAIVTLTGYFNYGNRLQNYALERTLSKLGVDVSTVINSEDKQTSTETLRNSKRNLFIRTASNIKRRVKSPINNPIYQNRLDIFKEFSNENIQEVEYNLTKSGLHQLSQDYDFFIVGSDQVWNPNFIYKDTINFLDFAPQDKRISYAASFGVSEIPDKLIKYYTNWLNGFSSISVREESAKKLVEELSEKEATVLVDPTMLLTKHEWLSIEKTPRFVSKKGYILTYFLGKDPEGFGETISHLKEKFNLDLVRLSDIEIPEYYESGPSEFISYINNSTIFLTDSFHGVVFSILLQRPFVIYKRSGNTMYSRIETILHKFNMNHRESEKIDWNANPFKVDFEGTLEVLEEERKKSESFLKNALQLSEEPE